MTNRPAKQLDFMVIGAPRSGTSWAANWLTTEHSLCKHDPLFSLRYDELDTLAAGAERLTGVSCTGLWNFSAWVNLHPAKKVVLHRPVAQINTSLRRIGLPEIRDVEDELNSIVGPDVVHVKWDQLFHPGTAALIAEHLGIPFDAKRHEFLRELQVGPRYEDLVVDTAKVKQMLRETTPGGRCNFECGGVCDGACSR